LTPPTLQFWKEEAFRWIETKLTILKVRSNPIHRQPNSKNRINGE
jgi:hypothetical protein